MIRFNCETILDDLFTYKPYTAITYRRLLLNTEEVIQNCASV
jgi:hypothetical protein